MLMDLWLGLNIKQLFLSFFKMKHPVGEGASRSSCFILVSGNKSFAAASAAGADIIEADNKCPGDTVYIMTVSS